jgi:hypothetical protein
VVYGPCAAYPDGHPVTLAIESIVVDG